LVASWRLAVALARITAGRNGPDQPVSRPGRVRL